MEIGKQITVVVMQTLTNVGGVDKAVSQQTTDGRNDSSLSFCWQLLFINITINWLFCCNQCKQPNGIDK